MASLSIPDAYEDGFAKLIALTGAVRDQLLAALLEAPMALRPSVLASQTAVKLGGSIGSSDLEEIVEALASLYYISEDFDNKDELAQDLVEAIEDSRPGELKLPATERECFKQQLSKFLDVDSLRIASKALFLLHEYERVFCSARVMTDIRPIFGSSPDDAPRAALIVHTLKLNYHDATGLKQFYITMDSDEMDELMFVLDRAESKAKSLKAVLDIAKLPHVDAGI